MEAGTKITVTLKDGSKIEGTFVEAKAGWVNYTTADGGASKARAKDVEVFMTKEEKKAALAKAKQEAKDKAAAEKQAAKDKAAAEKAKAKEKAAKAKKAPAPAEGDEEADERLVPADLSRYVLHETKTASGRRHIDVNDDTADKLRELDLPGVYKYAAKVLETTVKELTEAYQHLNPGMQRMNLGNRIRKQFKVAAEVNADLKKAA